MKKNKWVIMTFLSVIFLFFTSCGQENVENNTQKNEKRVHKFLKLHYFQMEWKFQMITLYEMYI